MRKLEKVFLKTSLVFEKSADQAEGQIALH